MYVLIGGGAAVSVTAAAFLEKNFMEDYEVL